MSVSEFGVVHEYDADEVSKALTSLAPKLTEGAMGARKFGAKAMGAAKPLASKVGSLSTKAKVGLGAAAGAGAYRAGQNSQAKTTMKDLNRQGIHGRMGGFLGGKKPF